MKNPFLLLMMLVVGVGNLDANAAEEQKSSPAEMAIRKNIDAFVEAYGKQDAGALAALWSEGGRFLSPITGNVIVGRKGIEEAYRALFKQSPAAVLSVQDPMIRFITADVAVEEGVARLAVPNQDPVEEGYQVIHVKKEGRWLIDSIRETVAEDEDGEKPEAAEPVAPDVEKKRPIPELEKLAWMVGNWVDAGDGSSVTSSCTWAMGKCFLRKDFSVEVEGIVKMDGVEIIGWDSVEKQFRSWLFDSAGGFGTATWLKSDDGWIKKVLGTTADGKKLYAEHVIHQVNANTYRWEAHGREADGVPLPNIPSTEVIRATESTQTK